MPTYRCLSVSGRLTPAQRQQIAGAITRIHHQVTGAPAYFAQVIFQDIGAGQWFMGGKLLHHDHIFVQGHIRGGRTAADKDQLIREMAAAVGEAAGIAPTGVWVYVSDIPPAQMIEFGHVLPEPGGEAAWTEALPEDDRAWMEKIGG